MKKYVAISIIMIGLLAGYTQIVSAQRHYVDQRPKASVVVRSTAPSGNHVWISDEWTWRGGRYENVPQHWEVRPPNHRHWVSGEWKHHAGHGNYWVEGHWN